MPGATPAKVFVPPSFSVKLPGVTFSVNPNPVPPAGAVCFSMMIVPVVAPAGGVPIWPRISSLGVASRAAGGCGCRGRETWPRNRRRARGVIGMLALSGDVAEGKVNATGPLLPNGATCTCAAVAPARLCVHWIASDVAGPSRSAVQFAVAVDAFGGTTCEPFAVNETRSTVRGRICPRISPAGRPAVWMLM